jgi:integrase
VATFRQRITDRGEKRWQAIVRRKHLKDEVATFTTLRAAKRWAAIVEGRNAERRHIPGAEAEHRTVNDALDKLERELSPERLDDIAGQIRWWREAIGDKPLSELLAKTPNVLSQQVDRLVAEPFTRAVPRKERPISGTKRRKIDAPLRKRSPGTVNRYIAVIGKALSIAKREGWIDFNPTANVTKRQEPRGRTPMLTPEQVKALLDACAQQSAELHALALLALCTGARAGELRGLKWQDIQLERNRALLYETKNDEPRALTLAGPALALLVAREKTRRTDTELVLPHPGLDKPLDYAKPFRAALKAAGITGIRFHDLRHHHASALAMSGASTQDIAAALGHKTLEMVKKYTHLTETHVSSVVERMVEKNFGPQP